VVVWQVCTLVTSKALVLHTGLSGRVRSWHSGWLVLHQIVGVFGSSLRIQAAVLQCNGTTVLRGMLYAQTQRTTWLYVRPACCCMLSGAHSCRNDR
jgi:hypothetical protein